MLSSVHLSFNNNISNFSTHYYDDVLSLGSVLSVSAEYFLATSILSIALFFVLLPKVQSKYFNTEVKVFSFISSQFNFLSILILLIYCFLLVKQHFLVLSEVATFTNSIFNDYTSLFAKLVIGFSSIIYLLFIQTYLVDQKLYHFEYYILILTSILGFCLLCCSNDLLTAYLAIELQGLSFYALASFKKTSNYSAESGVKYFILGSFSTIIFLLGINLIYGVSGTIFMTDFKDLFLWVFSVNSFFFSFESLLKAISFFDLENFFNNDSDYLLHYFGNEFSITQFQSVLSKFSLLKNQAYLSVPDVGFLLSYNSLNFNYFVILDMVESNLLEQISYMDSLSNANQNYVFLQELVYFGIFEDFVQWLCAYGDLTSVDDVKDIGNFQKLLAMQSLFSESLIDLKSESYYLLANFLTDTLNSETITKYSMVVNPTEESLTSISNTEKEVLEFLSVNNNSLEPAYLSLIEHSKAIPLESTYFKNLSDIQLLSPYFLDVLNVKFSNLNPNFVFDNLLIEVGLLLILIALFLKLALTPFHLWSPDVYEGSPSSSTFFFVVVSKISIFVFLLKICYLSFYSAIADWQFYLLLVAVSSILLGSIAALKQRKIKSLLAYSSISNMGLILASFSVGNFEGIKAVFYYFVIYIISGLAIWSIYFALRIRKKNYSEKYNKDLGDFTLLHESNGVLAYAFVITMFTIAGIPPMVGFLAKVGIFLSLIISSMNLIAFITIVTSVISTFYYIRILKVVFFENVLIGKLFYPITSKINIVRSLLFFLMLFLFISPSVMNFFSYKITLFLSKSFY